MRRAVSGVVRSGPSTLRESEAEGGAPLGLWRFDGAVVALVSMQEEHDASVLAAGEKALVDAAQTPRRRMELLAGRLAARKAFDGAGLSPPPAVLRTSEGIPCLAPPLAGWFVSIAHDGDCAVAAVSRTPIGVDVLPVLRRASVERVVAHRLQTDRARALLPHPPAPWPDSMLTWTAWEALGKLGGGGVFSAMNLEIAVEAGSNELFGRAENAKIRWWESSGVLFCLATSER